jgi:ferredoxin
MTEIEWRSLFSGQAAEKPTYAQDVVGPIERFDERDCMLARMDLRAGTERYEAYYRRCDEFRAADDFLRSMPPLGSGAAPVDVAIMDALFDSILIAGRPPDDRVPQGAGLSAPRLAISWDPAAAAVKVKSLARHLGADLAGVGSLNPAFIYSHVGRSFYGQGWGEEIRLDHTHAISIGVAMDYGFLARHAPGFPVVIESSLAYAKAASVAVQLATYLRRLGYSARAHHLRDYQLLCVPVAVDCGLGELGRSGVLLTRDFGSAVRLATVTTDLPLAQDSPVDLGVQQFCTKCRMCAMACPSGAIPQGEKLAVRGVRRWKLSAGRCYHYWRQVGSDCALCLLACPWSRPDRETAGLRPVRPALDLDEGTLEMVARVRQSLPQWLRGYLGHG